jgi:hypothetical protein
MNSLFDGPLPKGMKLPKSLMDEMQQDDTEGGLTHVDVNYSKLIRQALEKIDEVDLQVIALDMHESAGSNPLVRIEIEVLPKDEQSHDK